MNESPGGELLIYQTDDGSSAIDVHLDGDTVWLNRQQMAALYARDVKTIGKHIGNALAEELAGFPVVAKFATTAADGKTYQVEHYNLDMVLSVGYRVKSPEGVLFRRWATTVLRDHLVTGYSVNQRRLDQLNQALRIIGRSGIAEVAGVASVLQVYAGGLGLLDDYDHQRLARPKGEPSTWQLTYPEARELVASMGFASASDLFGRPGPRSTGTTRRAPDPLSRTGTSESQPPCSSISSTATVPCGVRTVASASTTTHWRRSR